MPDTQSLINQMEAMFQKLMTQTVSTKLPTTAAGSAEPIPWQIDKRFDELSKQLKQLEQQTTQRPAYSASVAAYDQPQSVPPRFNQTCNWQGPPTRQIDQMQRHINRLENELRRYQNPRRPDLRSYSRNFRTVERDPICSFCQHVGHAWCTFQQCSRNPRLPPNQVRFSNRPQFSEQPSSRQFAVKRVRALAGSSFLRARANLRPPHIASYDADNVNISRFNYCEERIYCYSVILLLLVKIGKANVGILYSLVLTSLSRKQPVDLLSINLFVQS